MMATYSPIQAMGFRCCSTVCCWWLYWNHYCCKRHFATPLCWWAIATTSRRSGKPAWGRGSEEQGGVDPGNTVVHHEPFLNPYNLHCLREPQSLHFWWSKWVLLRSYLSVTDRGQQMSCPFANILLCWEDVIKLPGWRSRRAHLASSFCALDSDSLLPNGECCPGCTA